VRDDAYAFWSHPRARDAAFTSTGSTEMPRASDRSENPYDTNKFKRDPSRLLDQVSFPPIRSSHPFLGHNHRSHNLWRSDD
jgi:hypothetical protein